ncbi:MAG: zinc ribbon domain-containing protein [Pseudomonadota bacterium]
MTTRICVACASEIDARATLCPHCGTRQEPIKRWAVRIAAILSALSVLLSVITVGVSLFPTAWIALFPEEKARLYDLSFNRADFRRTQARFSVANYGNQDLYINRFRLMPSNPELAKLNNLNFAVGEWLRVAENRTLLIPMKEMRGDHSAIAVASLPKQLARLNEVGIKPTACLKFLLHKTDENGSYPPTGHRVVGAVFDMDTQLFYSSVETRGDLRPLPIGLKVQASLMWLNACDGEIEKRLNDQNSQGSDD